MHPTFGRYELLERLAGGGMGEVYLARQRGIEGFQKLLVIKTLLPHLCEDDEFITMFKDEARLTAQLIHPNICQVFEFDQVQGTYYIAMEYLRGDDLRRLWKACEHKARPLRVPLICRIIADAAAGLDFAHALRDQQGQPCNIVHRDISPQNILVTFEGGVKVIDFGVAKAAGRAQHTRTGALKGKYSYMSPEQVAGRPIDGRTDIFALGIVLHELLTGRRLFKADSDVETLERVRRCIVVPPSELNPQIPKSLDGIVLHALAKDPDRRFQTAQAFRLALEDWLIQGRMSASSAHLAEFLKVIYAERLDKEARLGPLLGNPGLSAHPDQLRPTPAKPVSASSIELKDPPPMSTPTSGTVNQRVGSKSDVHEQPTQSGAAPFAKARWPAAIAAAVVLVGVAAGLLLARKPSQRAPEREPVPVAAAELAPAPLVLERAPAQHLTVLLKSEPSGAEITEGNLVLGRTPFLWTTAPAERHTLGFSLRGHKELVQVLEPREDQPEITVKLRKLEPARKAEPLGDIKFER